MASWAAPRHHPTVLASDDFRPQPTLHTASVSRSSQIHWQNGRSSRRRDPLDFQPYKVRTFVSPLERFPCWNKESIPAILKQTQLVIGDASAQMQSQVTRQKRIVRL